MSSESSKKEIKQQSLPNHSEKNPNLPGWCMKTSELVDLDTKRYAQTELEPNEVWVTAKSLPQVKNAVSRHPAVEIVMHNFLFTLESQTEKKQCYETCSNWVFTSQASSAVKSGANEDRSESSDTRGLVFGEFVVDAAARGFVVCRRQLKMKKMTEAEARKNGSGNVCYG
ncbi:hypothetical protein E6C27_scaffold271G00590 [Cucumis melo var. makuwa]|uniref:Uncharacterized protein n=1 Tax=Cucumis melo var. makuwa TaxID=1194695 RepID=A0A5A7VF88_CUCMM|nr:hypothetical protein E6C27_scaffold271G00590 [Cucumis melo var. makuwa]